MQTLRSAAFVIIVANAYSVYAQPMPAAEQEAAFESMTVDKTQIQLQFAPALTAKQHREIRTWIDRSARVVADYFGAFPVPAFTVLVIAGEGAGVKSGTTFSDPELRIRIRLGRDTTPEQYLTDWIMVHEMVHLTIPEVPRHQNWFHEGAATYIEIISRARAGLSSANGGWTELMRNMDQGMPAKGDRGLDHTPTWGRTYWGGAMFFLMADVELRRLSNNRIGLPQAMRGIVASGGSYQQSWPLAKTLRAADQATGLTVLTDLHQRLKDDPSPPALAALWRDLGVTSVDGVTVLRNDAPLAEIREAIIGAPFVAKSAR